MSHLNDIIKPENSTFEGESSFSFGSFVLGVIATVGGLFFLNRKSSLSSKVRTFDDRKTSDKESLPHEGKVSKYRVYVQRDSGGKDYYFPTVVKAAKFYEKAELEKSRDPNSDIYKIRPSDNVYRAYRKMRIKHGALK